MDTAIETNGNSTEVNDECISTERSLELDKTVVDQVIEHHGEAQVVENTQPTTINLETVQDTEQQHPDDRSCCEEGSSQSKTDDPIIGNDLSDDSPPISSPKPVEFHGPEEEVKAPSNSHGKKKIDDKLSIYKALAIKLKKELVKTRDELQKLRDQYQDELADMSARLKKSEETLENERLLSSNTNATLEAAVKSLRNQLESAESDLQTTQTEFENYKTRATQIMHQNNPVQSFMQSNKGFEEERYKQMKQLYDDYKLRVSDLSGQLTNASAKNQDLETQLKDLTMKLEEMQQDRESMRLLELRCEKMNSENEKLKNMLEQYNVNQVRMNEKRQIDGGKFNDRSDNEQTISFSQDRSDSHQQPFTIYGDSKSDNDDLVAIETQISTPSASSVDSYVHVKQTKLEIIGRPSTLDEALNQIDNLTKAYSQSESNNSLLSEQVRALKEEIRRIQRGTERKDLADNLEYLKNVVFRFLSLDDNSLDQKQRLIPVLSTVLKLSPEETAKLSATISSSQWPSVTSSLFKLGI